MIVDGSVSLEDLYIQCDSLEELDQFMGDATFVNSAFLVKVVLDPKETLDLSTLKEEDEVTPVISYTSTFCLADFGIFESSSSSLSTDKRHFYSSKGLPASLELVKQLALEMKQPFFSSQLNFEGNHISRLLGEYFGGYSNSCQSCFLIFPDQRHQPNNSSGNNSTLLEGLKFGELMRTVQVHPRPHFEDIYSLKRANYLQDKLNVLVESKNEQEFLNKKLEQTCQEQSDALVGTGKELEQLKKQHDIIILQADYIKAISDFEAVEAKIQQMTWKTKDLVRKYKLLCDAEHIDLLLRKNSSLEHLKEKLHEQVSALEEASRDAIHRLEKESQLKSIEIKEFTTSIGRLEQEKNVTEQQMSLFEKQLASKEAVLQNLQEENHTLKKDFEKVNMNSQSLTAKQQLSLKEKSIEVESLMKEIRYLEQQRDAMQSKLNQLEKDFRLVEKENTKLESSLLSSEKQNTKLENELSKLEHQLDLLKQSRTVQATSSNEESRQLAWIEAMESKMQALERMTSGRKGDIDEVRKRLSLLTKQRSQELASNSVDQHQDLAPNSIAFDGGKHVAAKQENRLDSEDEFSFSKAVRRLSGQAPPSNTNAETKKRPRKKVARQESDPDDNFNVSLVQEKPKNSNLARRSKPSTGQSESKRKSIVMPRRKSIMASSSEDGEISEIISEEDISQYDIHVDEPPKIYKKPLVAAKKNDSGKSAAVNVGTGKIKPASTNSARKSVVSLEPMTASIPILKKTLPASNGTSSMPKLTAGLSTTAKFKSTASTSSTLKNPLSTTSMSMKAATADISSENSGFLSNLSFHSGHSDRVKLPSTITLNSLYSKVTSSYFMIIICSNSSFRNLMARMCLLNRLILVYSQVFVPAFKQNYLDIFASS